MDITKEKLLQYRQGLNQQRAELAEQITMLDGALKLINQLLAEMENDDPEPTPETAD